MQISSNDGGGGERVLWCCVDALQKAYPEIDIVIFTGRENDTITANQILQKANKVFNLNIPESSLEFVFLKSRWLVEDKTWPHFTLLGQSLGSIVLGWEAINKRTPNCFIGNSDFHFFFCEKYEIFISCTKKQKIQWVMLLHFPCSNGFPILQLDVMFIIQPSQQI